MPVEMQLARIIISEINENQVVFLKEVDGDRQFPILIGIFEATSIDRRVKEVQRPRFAAANMDRYFPHVVISDEVGVAKPHPRIFDICFEKMGNPAKSDVLIIGDGLTSDMRGGIDYGIDTCWVNLKGKTRPVDMPMTYEINTLSQLAPILEVA